jgi:outer membrane receptor protein involved in Fe transport
MGARRRSSGPAPALPDVRTSLRLGPIAAAVALAIASSARSYGADTEGPTAAAPKASEASVEEVVVTGSRIQRRDYEANSPIVTISDDLLKQSSTAAIETNLTKLPQFHAVQTPAQGGDIQPTATNTPGGATVSLRGIGANRDLILLDGRRATPGNASEVVDINTIPALAIERVETITGGASATYGADAVSGVVNFILRKKFEGLQFDAQAGASTRGDAFEYQVSGLMGSNFADNRGNVMLAFAINDRQSAKHIDRPWFASLDKDPNTGGTNAGLVQNDIEYFPDFSGYDPFGTNIPTQAAVNSIFGAGAGVPNNQRFYFNPDGTAFTGFFQSGPAGAFRFEGDLTGTKWKQNTNGQLTQSFQDALAVVPLHRDNIYTRGEYAINDWISFFAQGLFSKVETHTVQQPSPSVNGWSVLVPNDGRAIPGELATLLNSRPDPTGDYQLVYYLNNVLGNRASTVDVFSYQMLGGFEGTIPGGNWTWEAYASKGQSETSSLLTGVASLERFRAVVSAPNWGAGFSAQGNPAFGGFGANTATCTSGLNPFQKDIPITQDCKDAVAAPLQNRGTLEQDVFEVNTQGKLLTLPAGDLRLAAGLSHRQDKYQFQNDNLTTQGESFQDQAIGIYPSGNSNGEITVKEVYAEALVPVLKDLPAIQLLELELGGRYSDYDTTGGATTWKALLNWRPVSFVRIRGGYNRAVRAPNIAELYLAPQQTFVFNGTGDLCSLANPSPYSANPVNPNSAQALALCKALMEKSLPGTSTNFYNNVAASHTVGGTFAFPTLKGNPNAEPEEANTWTLGAVFTSPWDSPLLKALTLSVDYYHINVNKALGPQSVDIAQRQCFDPAFNPTYSVNSPYCLGINRVANDGALGNIITTYLNNGRFQTEGIDTSFDWSIDIGPGRFNFNSQFSYLIALKSAELSSDPLVDYAGTLGPPGAGGTTGGQNGLDPGAFQWRMFNTFGYTVGPMYASIQWQHIPETKAVEAATVPNTPFTGAASYDLFNLALTYAIGKSVLVRGGIDNVLDKSPPLTEVDTAPPPGLLRGGAYNEFLYDMNGRRYYLGLTVNF